MSDGKQEKRALGRGLSALMADIEPAITTAPADNGATSGETIIPISKLYANPDQPRKIFAEDDLRDLARSIEERGIIQPLIVREDPNKKGAYQIVAGERRWRAAQMAKVDQLPVLVRSLDDQQVLEIGIIENIQRADLNPIDEAASYQQLMDRFGHTQEKVSEALGKSRSHIANMLRLLTLPKEVLHFVQSGQLSAGHARTLITSDDPVKLANLVISKGMSVRQTEALVKSGGNPAVASKSAGKKEKDSDTVSLEADLSANLGMKVDINHTAGGKRGKVTISYRSLEQLDALCALLSTNPSAGST